MPFPGLLAIVLTAGAAFGRKDPVVRIGYFHGGRTSIIYRTYLNGYFEKEGIDARLLTQSLRDDTRYEVPTSTSAVESKAGFFGKVSGVELIKEMTAGRVDAALVGESSFLLAADKGADLVAVALLGHDLKDHPGHAIIFRKGLEIKTPQDIKGKTLASRRAGPGDDAFLREFIVSIGLDPDKDVRLIAEMDDDRLERSLRRQHRAKKKIDGGYFHLMALRRLVEHEDAAIYRPMDWVNAELSQALLVFNGDFVRRHPDLVEKAVRACVREIAHEKSLTPEQRRSTRVKGLQIEEDFHGMNLPQCDLPPLVRKDLLKEMQRLLVKHKKMARAVELQPFIDNRFVESAARDLAPR